MKRIVFALLALAALCLLAAPAYAAIPSTRLIGDMAAFSGQRVVYQGEAIGDVMERGSHGWVNLHDGDNAIGVWAPVEMLRTITFVGDYNHIGDTVVVEGVFNQACSEHGGDIDIHAERLRIVTAGREARHPVDRTRAAAAGILTLVAGALFAINRYYKRHFVAHS